MARISLLHGWSVMSRDKLEKMIQAETARTVGKRISLEEEQLLNAAHSRLLSWRTPSRNNIVPKGKFMRLDDNEPVPDTEPEVTETPKKKRGGGGKKKKVAPAKKKAAADMNGAKAKFKAKARSEDNRGERQRIPADAKIVKGANPVNPYREGSGAYNRTAVVLKNLGKTRETIEKEKGMLSTTIPNLVGLKVVRVA